MTDMADEVYYYSLLCVLKTFYYMGQEVMPDSHFDAIEKHFKSKFPNHEYFNKVGLAREVPELLKYTNIVKNESNLSRAIGNIPKEIIEKCLFK